MNYSPIIQKKNIKYGESKEIAFRCHKLGMTSKEILSKYNMSKSCLKNALRRMNLRLKPVHPTWGGHRNNVQQ